MDTITIDKDQLQDLVKSSLIEILKNREDMFEIMEDLIFGKIMDNEKTGIYTDKEKIMQILNR